MKWAWGVARMGARRDAYRVLVRNPEGKKPLGRPRRGWNDNMKIDGFWVGVDSIDVAQVGDRWRVPKYVAKLFNS